MTSRKDSSNMATIKCEHAILVHGTGATAESHHGDAWWQNRGPLWGRLEAANCEGRATLNVEAFIWSGENSEQARHQAGNRLVQRLTEIADAGNSVHLVGHSHGGSVIWHALNELQSHGDHFDEFVRSWSSVGTPFLKYEPRFNQLVLAGCATTLALAHIGFLALASDGAHWTFAWRDTPGQLAMWCALVLVPIAVLFFGIKSLLPFLIKFVRSQRASAHLTSSLAVAGYLSLWSTQDEPILGLGASGSIALKVLPESRRYSPAVRRNPIAVAVNQFVSNLISRTVQGNTASHMQFRSADNFPHPKLAHHPLPQKIDAALIDAADEHAGRLGSKVRQLLVSGASPTSGFENLTAATTEAMSFKEMVHTTYFGNLDCVALLLHHIQHRSHLSLISIELEPDLRDYYETRHTLPPTLTKHQLPSNRMALAVAMSVTGIAIVLGLAAIAQKTLSETALTPTTAIHQMSQAISPKHLGALLGAIIPAGRLETVLRLQSIGWSDPKPDEYPATFNSVSMEAEVTADPQQRLKRYVLAALRAGEHRTLFAAVARLETAEMRELFFILGWPTMLAHASAEQIAELVAPSAVFPGREMPHSPGMTILAGFTAVDQAIEHLGKRNLLTPKVLDAFQAHCKTSNYCRNRMHLLAAISVLESSPRGDHHWLRPLPKVRVSTDVSFGDKLSHIAMVTAIFPNPTARSGKHFLNWAASNGDWEVFELFTRRSYLSAKLDWGEVGGFVETALSSKDERNIRLILHAVIQANWSKAIPVKALDNIVNLAKRNMTAVGLVSKSTEPTMDTEGNVTPIDSRVLEKFARAQTKTRVCEEWLTTVVWEVEEESTQDTGGKMLPGGIYCAESAEERVRRRELEKIRRVTEESESFGRQNGMLSSFPALRFDINSPDRSAKWRSALFSGIRRATCESLTEGDFAFDVFVDEDVDRLRRAFHSLGPVPTKLPSEVADWLAKVREPTSFCPLLGEAPDSGARDRFRDITLLFTYHVADWIADQHAEVAHEMMSRISGRIDNNLWRSAEITPFLMSKIVTWFSVDGRAVDVLGATHGYPTPYRLARRAAYLHLAACELSNGRKGRSAQLEQLAISHGDSERLNSAPREVEQLMQTEIFLHAVKGDWRSASLVCERCEASLRAALTSRLIAELAAVTARVDPPKMNCDQFDENKFDSFIRWARHGDSAQ